MELVEALRILMQGAGPGEPAYAADQDDEYWRLYGTLVDVIAQPSGGVSVGGSSVKLLSYNPRRRGLQIVNVSTGGVTLTLGDGPASQYTGMWLTGGGGSWDGRLSNRLWQGSVYAIADAGPNTLSVVTV